MATEIEPEMTGLRKRGMLASDGSYVLRPVVNDVALATDFTTKKPQITCVELWENNLYIGTSAAEVLHFVSIPADSAEESMGPTFIFASRLQPKSTQLPNSTQVTSGVQQILPLAAVKKVCILCNNILTFYSLPELSPALNNSFVQSCSWVGGMDLNNRDTAQDGVQIIMICIKNRIRLVGIGDGHRAVRIIEFPGCLASARRENYACVADSNSYSLLDVENQQKINLFPISSLDENAGGGKVEDISPAVESRPSSSSISGRPGSSHPSGEDKSHGRSTSLGMFVTGLGKRQGSPASRSRERFKSNNPEPFDRSTSPQNVSHADRLQTSRSPIRQSMTPEKPLPAPPEQQSFQSVITTAPTRLSVNLKPHIVSPSSSEFLLTTGTTPTEPGVGIFVNLDGDVVRGTLEFSRYPTAVVVDGNGSELESEIQTGADRHQGHVIAAISPSDFTKDQPLIEIQKWGGNEEQEIGWLSVPTESSPEQGSEEDNFNNHGLRAVHTAITISFPEVGTNLRATRLRLPSERIDNPAVTEKPALEDWEVQRNKEEAKFTGRLGGQKSNIVVWTGSSIWWIVRTPLALKLDADIGQALEVVNDDKNFKIDRVKLYQIINKIRDQEGTTETEFLSLEYVRQKISLILFCDLIMQSSTSPHTQSSDKDITEALLREGNIDPRVVLSMIPLLREEIVEGEKGIWIHSGLIWIVQRFWLAISHKMQPLDKQRTNIKPDKIIGLIKRYLFSWRKRKGFGSIADEVEVFKTIDAALLHLLLHYDSLFPSGSSKPSSSREELYSVVDSGVSCFDRAVALLESYQRLYVLSRLYGSRKMAGNVLQTWRRIIDGERDAGDELVDGENEVRRYLVKIRDPSLFHEYGTWLARRNPTLGVQVYTDDNSRVKLPPHQVVEVLQNRAPEAVKVYLEHLVFGKKNFQYANNLISYYLDNVLSTLGSSREAQEILSQSYETYRALQPPKPTYRQFVIDNAVPVSWWHDRLRLLELLGGSHGADFSYNVAGILSRIEPFEQDLVPESIILDGRQGRHQQALRLLIHGLGDYHTAINYCLLGGASIFYPTSGTMSSVAAPTNEEQAILFGYLLEEFLRIENVNNRLERTSELLERFGSWYEVSEVLSLIPESWSVEMISGFLINSFRRLVQEKNEAMITKALSGAENLQIASIFIERCNALGPQIDGVQ